MVPESHLQLFLENEDPETTKPAEKAGHEVRSRPGEWWRLVNPSFPDLRPLSIENDVFDDGELCADFRPLCGGLQPERSSLMRSFAQCLPLPVPALAGTIPKTYAAWPVWSDSTTKEIKYQPMPRKAATRLWHRARDFDRQTRRKDHHGGAVGHSALQVLHALIFDFLNFRSGQLDPSYAAIARKANVCQRTVATAIQRLKSLGILNWVRRCAESRAEDGRFVLEQETNAYAVLPASQWRGYREPPEAPPPAQGTWGDHPPLTSLLAQASAERQAGGTMQGMIGILDSDPSDALAMALARLGRAVQTANLQ